MDIFYSNNHYSSFNQFYYDSSIPIWVDLTSEHKYKLKEIKKLFKIHNLTFEDCTTNNTRTKFERFSNYHFVVLYNLSYFRKFIGSNEIDFIVGSNFLITIQHTKLDVFKKLKTHDLILHRLLPQGVDFMFYTLTDLLIDGVYPILETIDKKLDTIQKKITTDVSGKFIKDLFDYKNSLNLLKSKLLSQTEVITSLTKPNLSFISPNVSIYFRDINDHLLRLLDHVNLSSDSIRSSHDLLMSLNANKMNEVMKVLTVMSTIFLPITFIVGLYGMNFKFMPELNWSLGYYIVIIIMIVITLLLLFFFKKKGWLSVDIDNKIYKV